MCLSVAARQVVEEDFTGSIHEELIPGPVKTRAIFLTKLTLGLAQVMPEPLHLCHDKSETIALTLISAY